MNHLNVSGDDRADLRIAQHGDRGGFGSKLVQQAKLLSRQISLREHDASRIAAGQQAGAYPLPHLYGYFGLVRLTALS